MIRKGEHDLQKFILSRKNHITLVSGILIAAAYAAKLVFANPDIFR